MSFNGVMQELLNSGKGASAVWSPISLLEGLLSSLDDAVVIEDLNGRIAGWNRGAERMFGYTAAEAVGRPLAMLVPASMTDEAPEHLERVRSGELIEQIETVRVAKSGMLVPVSLTSAPLRDDAGRVVGVLRVARDISARQEWDRTKLLLAAVVESSDDAIMTKDLDGLIMTWNKGAERIFGYAAEEIIGQPVTKLIPLERRSEEGEIMSRLRAGDRVEHFETLRMRKDGRLLDVSLTISPLKDARGRIIGASKIARDITEKKRTERLLAEHRDHLNELVEKRTAELRASEHRLRLSERMAALGTLAAGLGHDMGNLLMPVRVRLEALEASAPAELRGDLSAIGQATQYLGQLASGLRMLAHDPDGTSPPHESTDLRVWWSEVMALMRTAAPRGVRVSARIGEDVPRVRLGRAALTQAVFNLVQNAGEALRVRGEGSVEVWAEAGAEEGTVCLGVTDDGPGMTEEVRNRCLEPFFSTKTRGISTGLGLSLVQGIAQRAGGRVEVESSPGNGTTVVLVVPAVAGSAAGGAPGGERAVAAVTLAESRVRSFASTVLSSLSFEVVSNGELDGSALLWVTDGPPDAERVSKFLAEDPRRRVVVYGEASAGLTGDRVATVKPPFRPTALREELVRAVRALGEAVARS